MNLLFLKVSLAMRLEKEILALKKIFLYDVNRNRYDLNVEV